MSFAKLKSKIFKSNFVKGAIILSVGAIICKLIGAVYRVPLTNILGSEGMGLYQMVYPIFTLLLVISSSGIPNGISRLISAKSALWQKEYVKKIIKLSLILMLVIGLIFSLVMFFFSDELAHMQGNPLASNGYKAIAPSILLVALISVFRGVFQGQNNMTPTAISQIIEQVIKLVLGLGIGYIGLGFGLEYGVAGALLGISIGELISLIYLIIHYNINKKHLDNLIAKDDYVPKNMTIIKEILHIVIPITLASTFMPIILVVDSVLLVNLLSNAGLTTADATSAYGLYSGVANTVINMPVVVASALATVLVPTICAYLTNKEVSKATDKINSAFESIMFIAVPAFLGFLFFGGDIIRFLFPSVITDSNYDVGNMLMIIGSINVLLISIVQVTSSILQCINKLWVPAIGMFVGCLVKVGISILLISTMGILAGMIASVVCYLIVAVINLKFVNDLVEVNLSYAPICLCASVIFIGISYIIRFFLYDLIGVWGSILALALGAIVYVFILWVLFTKKKIFTS